MIFDKLQDQKASNDFDLLKKLFPEINTPQQELRFFLLACQDYTAQYLSPVFEFTHHKLDLSILDRVLKLAAKLIPQLRYSQNLIWDNFQLLERFQKLDVYPEEIDKLSLTYFLEQFSILDMLDYFEKLYFQVGVDLQVDSKIMSIQDNIKHQSLKAILDQEIELIHTQNKPYNDFLSILESSFGFNNQEILTIHLFDASLYFKQKIISITESLNCTQGLKSVSEIMLSELNQILIHLESRILFEDQFIIPNPELQINQPFLGLNRDLYYLILKESALYYGIISILNSDYNHQLIESFLKPLRQEKNLTKLLIVYETFKRERVFQNDFLDKILLKHKASLMINQNHWNFQKQAITESQISKVVNLSHHLDISNNLENQLLLIVNQYLEDQITNFESALSSLPTVLYLELKESIDQHIQLHLGDIPNRQKISKNQNLIEFKIRSLGINLQDMSKIFQILEIIEERTLLEYIIQKKA